MNENQKEITKEKLQEAIIKLENFNNDRKSYADTLDDLDNTLFDEFTEVIETAISAMKYQLKNDIFESIKST